jgi:hypothetical protein
LTNHTSDKELFTIQKELLKLSSSRSNPILKQVEDRSRCFTKEDVQKAEVYMKRRVTLLTITRDA